MLKPSILLPIEQQSESVLVRMMLWDEARGEPVFTKLCIHWVVKNRANRNNTSMRVEILKRGQFSGFASKVARLRMLWAPTLSHDAWVECCAVADIFNATKDPTGGADHFYNFKTSQPSWGRGHADWKERLVAPPFVFGSCP